MPIVQCKICEKSFYAKPFLLKKGYGKYCSRKCQHLGRKNGKMVKCFICDKIIYKQLKALLHSKSRKYFCSKSCQTKWRNSEFVGKKHANWKNGKYAYKSVLIRHHIPKECKLCKTKDIRILAIHHIDKKRTNNGVNNLTWLCHNCHCLVHHDIKENKKLMEILV